MPDTSSPLHRAAREWAELGYPIFPIMPDDKRPATEHGWKDATTDLTQIDAWWTENPHYNIGWSPELSGMMVLDADPPLGLQTIEQIVAQEGAGSWPQTYTVQTPRGGFHYWFVGSAKSTVGTERVGLGPKLDTRGRGGYVLLPPSIVNGNEYTIIDDREPVVMPDWINRRLQTKEESHVAATEELDLPANVERARHVLARRIADGDIATEGAGGDDRTLRQIFELRDLGVSAGTTLQLLTEENGWNDHCVPPWEQDDLGTKIGNAFRYAQNEAGAYAVAPPAEAFADFIKKQPKPPRPKFYAYSESEQDAWPEPSWLVPELLPDEATVMLYGQSRSYKSFLALDLALGLAYGKETFGARRDPIPTLFIAGESPRGLSRQRRPAWKLAREADGDGQFYMIPAMPTILNGGIAALRDQLRAQSLKPRFIVIDTLAKAMAGMNENDARDAGMFIEGVEALRDEFKATVLMIHHTGKETDRGARGSSAFFNGFDTVMEAVANNDTTSVEIFVRKQKDADEREQPWRFQGRMIGPGLVFFPVSQADYDSVNKSKDIFDHRSIGAALMALRAIGPENGVTSITLASKLLPANQNETTDARTDAVMKIAHKLGRLSKMHLEAYTTGEGRSLRWSMPAPKQ